jgi:3-oxoacyl-(acyl-carrier-protein) synthase/thioesterase domain-containing protein/acyl carrier protein
MNEDSLENAIAIIGLSGKFPGADDIQVFWENVCNGKETISSFSDEELIAAGLSKSQIKSPGYVQSRGILNGIEFFDAEFFGFNAKEAQLTDPQHRLFLECAWEALENAGYCSDNYPGSIGVYGGTGMSSYYLNNIHPNRQLRETLGDFLLHIGNDKDFLTTRVSYKLNLKGPSIAVQTACSTSLVAVCVACNHLLTYQCDMALAGGVAISVPQLSGYLFQEGMILSGDGRCRPFDAAAQGTVMSNGVGIVVLKRLQDALADKDHIFAVIRGYGINNDGSRKIGYSAPSVEGQAETIVSAISMAGIDPETVTYAEAHGTGTILGDPIEIQGLTNAFHSIKKQYCAIGSIKSNIGHTVEAAGVIGLIKAVLALHHRKIPPSLHFNKPNPHIDFAETPFYVNTVLKEWEAVDHPRRACVSSFGIGGTNAHAILEECPQRVFRESPKSSYPLVLSARTLTALKTMAINLGQHLQKYPEFSLADVAYTLHMGRKLFEHKRVLVCRDREEAISLLLSFDPDKCPVTPDFSAEELYEGAQYHRVPLPTYPFEKKRYWIDPPQIFEEPTSSDTQCHSIETTLINIWREFLGTESVGIHDNFFQLGGDSLLAIEMAAYLSKQFGVSLGMQTLLAHPTIAKLSTILSERTPTASPLIPLRSGSTGTPLFLIHPIEGNLFCYKGLVDVLTCQNPLYGIQAVDTEIKSIEELASFYIGELRKVQPKGCYHLLGMSFGGIVAYEMARQLDAKGDSVALLCMIDVERPAPIHFSLSNDEEMLAYLVELLEGKPALDKEITIEKVIQSLGLGMLSLKDQQIIFNRVKAHLWALANYQPNSYGGNILFFQASQRFFRLKDICLGSSWKELVGGRIEIQEIPGNHANILMQPQVRQLANFLDAHLQSEAGYQNAYNGLVSV